MLMQEHLVAETLLAVEAKRSHTGHVPLLPPHEVIKLVINFKVQFRY